MFRGKDSYGSPKYLGRSKAVVKDNRDPLNKGRIVVDHPILGETAWIDYLKLPHQFDVPSIGDIVFVEAESGEYEFPIAWGNITKGLDEAPEIPEVFKREVPTNRGMYTPGGHTVELDDGESNSTNSPKDTDLTTKNRGIRITSKDGYKIHISEDSSNNKQEILLEAKDGSLIRIDVQNTKVHIHSEGNFEVTATSTKIDAASNEITGTLKVGGNTELESNLKVSGNSELGGSTPLILSTAQFIGTGNLGAPVISTLMSGQTSKVTGA